VKRKMTSSMFRSLRVRNYRYFFLGQLVSVCGTWMQTVALGWLVLHDLTDNSSFAVGVVTALQYVPMMVLGTWGGVIADRFDKRRVLIIAQSGLAASAAALAAITLTHVASLWSVYALALVGGVFNMLDTPARQAFVTEMVGREETSNAIGLNSSVFNASRIVGPAIGGVLIVTVGTGMCFVVNAVSYIAVIAGLLAMRPAELFSSPPLARGRGQVRDGLRYIWATPALRDNLIVMTVFGMLVLNFPVVLPSFASLTFHGDAGTYSTMTVMMGIGALAGSLFVAGRLHPTERMLVAGGLTCGAALAATAVAPTLAVACTMLVVVGFSYLTLVALGNSLLQTTAAPEYRGRVLAVRAIALLGTTPVGAPFIGWVCQVFGARTGLGVGSVATLAVFAWYRVSIRSYAGAGDRADDWDEPLADPILPMDTLVDQPRPAAM
jgi:MFS family permease